MPATVLPIANGFYVSPSLPISAQECTNFYPNINEAPSLNQETLFGTAGLKEVASTGTVENENRGSHEMNGVPYFVNGTQLYSLVETIVGGVPVHTLTSLGTVAGTVRVSMADNGSQLMILVPGGAGYIFTHTANTFVTITDVDFTANGLPQFVVFVDSYFVCTTNTKKFISSAPNNGTSWNALDYGTAESDPDDTVAPVVFKNQLFIAGSETIEAFQNIGGTDFPFQRTGLFLQKGVYAPYSLINVQDSFMFIGGGSNESPAVWALSGNSTVKVSTIPIDSILQVLSSTQLAAVFSWAYAQNGAYFVGFTLPNTTFVYDLTSKRWHERKSVVSGELGAFRVSSMVQAYNHILCGDTVDGRIGHLDPAIYSEYNADIIRTVSTQPFQNTMNSFSVPSIELTVESGVGNTTVLNPQISMDRSKDGKTWSDPRTRSIGKAGEYDRRAVWRRNGYVNRFEIFRFTLTDQVKPVIIQLTADIST
tara:strand:- start:1716 stop:3155 length:1440 start_codon:yes stop_codon:yes gene_type:complete